MSSTDHSIKLAKASLTSYFSNYAINNVVIGDVLDSNTAPINAILDYTGVIGFSGKYRGGMYITCQTSLVRKIMEVMMGGPDLVEDSPELFSDLVGEMANTLSGYFQKSYGDFFLISIPHVIMRVPAKNKRVNVKIKLKQLCFVLPFVCEGSKGSLVFTAEEV